MSSVDTVCPICWETVHSDKPVGVMTGCGHVMHQSCYKDWQKRGEYTYESSSGSRRNYNLNFNLNCLICNQPTNSFVDLFIRLPAATQDRKETVEKLEHEFNTVCRRTQLSLEKEIARRDFEQTWLQEERQISQAARHKVEQRHKQVIREMHRNLKVLKKEYQRKMSSMEERRQRRGHRFLKSGRSNDNLEQEGEFIESPQSSTEFSLDFMRNEEEESTLLEDNSDRSAENTASLAEDTSADIQVEQSSSLNVPLVAAAAAATSPVLTPEKSSEEDDNNTNENEDENSNHEARQLLVGIVSPDSASHRGQQPIEELPVGSIGSCQYSQFKTESSNNMSQDTYPIDPGTVDTLWTNHVSVDENDNNEMPQMTAEDDPSPETAAASRQVSLSPVRGVARGRRSIPKDTIFHPEDEIKTRVASPRGRRSIVRDEIFAPCTDLVFAAASLPLQESVATTDTPVTIEQEEEEKDKKQPAREDASLFYGRNDDADGREDDCRSTASRDESWSPTRSQFDESESSLSVVDYELQRLQADSAFYQHQAELVEWERHQAEIELEQDELALRQRELRIRMERSRLEQSFTFIQRRVKESKREARNRQKLSVLEEKYAKYKLARRREEERYEEELQRLKQDEAHVKEREQWEKERQEKEKTRLKKEVNELLKVKSKLEHEKEQAKQAEEQSSTSPSHETCVVCFEPLVTEESELGVISCGHAFHCSCFNSWEKSKRKRGTSTVPCPLCNVATSLCVTIRLNRPDCSLYCSAASSLTKHFQKQEQRWQRRRSTVLAAGDISLST